MPKPSKPTIGATVHFYELGCATPQSIIGPLPAIITAVEDAWTHDDLGQVSLAVFEEMALRFVPLVPYEDAGKEAGQWWTWPDAGVR